MEGEKLFEQKGPMETERQRILEVKTELSALTERFGQIERRVDGTLISNDEGFTEVILSIQKAFEGKGRRGIGFFVGSGGAPSLLPELPINIPLIVDKNKAVLELSSLLSKLISEEESPEAVLAKIRSSEIREQYPIVNDIISEFGDLDLVDAFIKKEGRQYGQFHWTNPQRFSATQAALRERSLVHVAVDITSPDFAAAITEISRKSGQSITFGNLTNVHSWLKPRSMNFLQGFPFESSAPVVFASHRDLLVGDWPKAKVVGSVEQYIQESDSEKD